jgi:uncharacterized protein YhfF
VRPTDAPTDDPAVRLLHAADEERRRIGRDLHDGPQQRLTALGHLLTLARKRLGPGADPGALELMERARDEATGTLDDLRVLARGLHPAGLTERGLPFVLETLAHNAPVPVELTALPERRLPAPVEVTVHALVSEALTNAARHARATRVVVGVEDRGASLHVAVQDDGIGGAVQAIEAGSGLLGLRDRVRSLGGTLTVEEAAPHGTRIAAVLPLAKWRTAYEPFLEFDAQDEMELVLAGERTVSFSILRELDLEGGAPRPGQRLPIRDAEGREHGAVEVTRSTICRFDDVTPDLVHGAKLGRHATFEAWLEDRKQLFDDVREQMAAIVGDPEWRLTPDELVVVLRFRPAPSA